MNEYFSLAEAAAISELSPEAIRTALEKNTIPLSNKRRAGKAVRHQFSFEDVLLLTVLVEFPFPLSKEDKAALRSLLTGQASSHGQWHSEGFDLVLRSRDITIVAECKAIKSRLSQNRATLQRGRQRVVSLPAILGGTPVFRGTRIPVDHIAGLIRKGVSEQEIAEDYPRLSVRDLAYAKLHARLGAPPGRPRKPLQIKKKQKAA